MTYLLDTNAFSSLMKGDPTVVGRLRAIAKPNVSIPQPVLAEVAYGPLLAAARGVVTINSSAGMQALREGKRVVALGTALYDLPGLTWQHGLDHFWTAATAPDMALVDALRRVLAAHCLVRGGFFDEDQISAAVAAAVERMTVRHAASAPSQLAQG